MGNNLKFKMHRDTFDKIFRQKKITMARLLITAGISYRNIRGFAQFIVYLGLQKSSEIKQNFIWYILSNV